MNNLFIYDLTYLFIDIVCYIYLYLRSLLYCFVYIVYCTLACMVYYLVYLYRSLRGSIYVWFCLYGLLYRVYSCDKKHNEHYCFAPS